MSDRARAIVELNKELERLRKQVADLQDSGPGGRLEEALRASEERFALFMRHLPGFAYLKDNERRILFVNDRFEADFGVPMKVWLGRTNDEVWPGEVGEKMRRDDEAALSGDKPVTTEEVVPTKGELRTYRTIKFPIPRPGKRPWLGGVSIDITDRKKAEEDLRRHTQGLSALLEVSKCLAATLDLETVLQATTDGVTKLFKLGTAAVYLLDRDMLQLRATTPPLPPQFPDGLRNASLADHPHIHEAISSGKPVFLPDTATAELTLAERTVTELRGLRSILYLPLTAGVKSVGSLIVASIGVPRTVSEEEIDLCRTLANLAALAVKNAQLYKLGQQYSAELELRMADRKKGKFPC